MAESRFVPCPTLLVEDEAVREVMQHPTWYTCLRKASAPSASSGRDSFSAPKPTYAKSPFFGQCAGAATAGFSDSACVCGMKCTATLPFMGENKFPGHADHDASSFWLHPATAVAAWEVMNNRSNEAVDALKSNMGTNLRSRDIMNWDGGLFNSVWVNIKFRTRDATPNDWRLVPAEHVGPFDAPCALFPIRCVGCSRFAHFKCVVTARGDAGPSGNVPADTAVNDMAYFSEYVAKNDLNQWRCEPCAVSARASPTTPTIPAIRQPASCTARRFARSGAAGAPPGTVSTCSFVCSRHYDLFSDAVSALVLRHVYPDAAVDVSSYVVLGTSAFVADPDSGVTGTLAPGARPLSDADILVELNTSNPKFVTALKIHVPPALAAPTFDAAAIIGGDTVVHDGIELLAADVPADLVRESQDEIKRLTERLRAARADMTDFHARKRGEVVDATQMSRLDKTIEELVAGADRHAHDVESTGAEARERDAAMEKAQAEAEAAAAAWAAAGAAAKSHAEKLEAARAERETLRSRKRPRAPASNPRVSFENPPAKVRAL